MAEQRCIICGNIVTFNRGEKVAVCEYCETRQEYIDAPEEPRREVYNEPVTHTDPTLKRARQITYNNHGDSNRTVTAEPVYVGSTASAERMRPVAPPTPAPPYAVPRTAPPVMPPVYPAPPKKSSAGKIVGIVLGAVAFTILMLIVIVSSMKNSVESANVTVSELEVGQYVSDIVVTSNDSEMYTATVSEVYYYSDSGNVYLNSYDTIDKEQTYYVVVEFVPGSRYKFDSRTSYYINDEYASTYSDGEKDTIKEIAMYAVDNTKETKQISSSWTSDKKSVNGYDASAKKLYYTAEDCIQFDISFQITACTKGNTDGNWCIYVRDLGGTFNKIDSFYYSGTSKKEITVYFDNPTDVDEIVIVPESVRELSWSHTIYPSNFVVKK